MSGVSPNQCYICYQAYNNERIPLILTTCGHTYCKECLLLILNSESREIICPECKQITTISENNDINFLPKNRSLLNLIIFNEENNYTKKIKKETKLKNKIENEENSEMKKKIQLEKHFQKYEEVLLNLDETYKNILNEHSYLNEISEILIMKEVDDVLDNFIDVINNHREDLQKKIKSEFAKVNLIKNFGKSINTLRKRLNCYISYFKADAKKENFEMKFPINSNENNNSDNMNNINNNNTINNEINNIKKKFNNLKEKKMKNFITGIRKGTIGENYNEDNDNNIDNTEIINNNFEKIRLDVIVKEEAFNNEENLENNNTDRNDNFINNSRISDIKINEELNLEDFLIKKNSTKSGQNLNNTNNINNFNNNINANINQEFKMKLEEELNYHQNTPLEENGEIEEGQGEEEEDLEEQNNNKNKKINLNIKKINTENPLNIPYRNSLDNLALEKMLKENDLSDLENEIQFSELYLLTLKQFSKEIYNPCQFFFVNKFQIEKLCHDLKKMLFKACDFDENIIKYKIKDLNNYEEKKFIKEIQEACSQSNNAKLKFLLTHFRINPNFIYSEVLDQITNHQGDHIASNPLGINSANNINNNNMNFHNINNSHLNQNPFHSLNIFDPISVRRNINNHTHRNLSNRYNSNILNASNIKDKVFNFYSYLKSFKDKTELNHLVRFLIDECDYLPLKIENETNFDMKLIKELDWKMELGVI
jgi:hypothetical protein